VRRATAVSHAAVAPRPSRDYLSAALRPSLRATEPQPAIADAAGELAAPRALAAGQPFH
jgi:hypothetical protein